MDIFTRSKLFGATAAIVALAMPAQSRAADFSIPSQSLTTALEQLARQGKTQILSAPTLVAGKKSRAVRGNLTIESALQRLLGGTGLSYKVSGSGFIIVAAQAAATAPVMAAQTEETVPPPSSESSVAELALDIVVTGSRVARSGYDAPTPTTVLGAATFEQRAAVTIADVLNDVPAFTPTTSTGTAGARPFAPGANYANLRSLGPTRTLVLVDGRRFAPTVPSFSTVGANQVDLNLIPPILLQRAEVVTGGASAQWGSDAVAGVVNLIINTKFSGVKGEAEKGISNRGDNSETRFAALVGHGFAADRGHVVLAGEYYRNEGVGDIFTRDWGQKEVQLVANGASATNGLPRSVISTGTRLATMTTGGLITSGPLRGTMFGPGGTTSTFNYGTLAGNLLMIGGGVPGEGLATGLMLVPKLERYGGFGHVDFDVSDRLSLFAEASYGVNKSQSFGIQPRDTGTITIQTTNPLLPAAVRTRAQNAGVTSFSFGRISDDIGHIDVRVRNENFRAAMGVKGELGSGWNWDAYYQFGQNDYRQDLLGQRINANFTLAVDAVTNSAGQVVCRSTLTNPTNGCVPINLFGQGAPSQAAIDYVTGDGLTDTRYRQHVAAANMRGEPFSSWAGPVSVAFGVEHRRERQNTTADAISMIDGFNQQNPKALRGSFHVTEGYLEAVMPLASGESWAKQLDLNGAIRYADYSTVGGVVTWKGGLSWSVNEWLQLRATRSRDIRAPNIFELNAAPSPSPSNVIDPRTNTQVAIRQFLSGNPNLREETANTLSLGIGIKPMRGFELSVDYYKITLEDAILSLQGTATINICQSTNDPFFCNNIIRNAAGTITRVDAPYINLGSLTTEGIDVEASYRFPVLAGEMSLRGIGTYTLHALSNNGFGNIDRVGEVGTNNNTVNPTPRFRGSFTANYQTGPVATTVQFNYIAKGKYDAAFVEGADIDENDVPARLYTNLNMTYTVADGRFQFYGAVANLFDVAPPNVPSTTFFFPTNPAFYDTIGRNFRVGVRVKL